MSGAGVLSTIFVLQGLQRNHNHFESLIAKVIVKALNYTWIQKVEYLDENSGQKIVVDHQAKCYEDIHVYAHTRCARIVETAQVYSLCKHVYGRIFTNIFLWSNTIL